MNKTTHIFTLLFFISVLTNAQTPYTLEWEKKIPELAANKVRVNPTDKSALFCTSSGTIVYNIECKKISTDGELEHEFSFVSPYFESSQVIETLFDEDGNTYYIIIAQTYDYLGNEQTISGTIVFVIKTDSSGEVVWEIMYQKDEEHFASVTQAVFSSDGFIYLAGTIADYAIVEEITYDEGFVLKLDTEGAIVWETFWESTIRIGELSIKEDRASLLRLQNYGNYYIEHINKEDGTVLSSHHFEDNDHIRSSIYYADNYGNYYLLQSGPNYKIEKYTANGDSLWQYLRVQTDVEAPSNAQKAERLAIDEENNTYCIGRFYTEGTGRGFLLTKLDETGNLIWEDAREGYGITDIIVRGDKILVAGYTYTVDPFIRNFLLLEYDTTGQFLQEIIYPGTNPEEDDYPLNMELDTDGNVYIAAKTVQNGIDNATLLKYSPPPTSVQNVKGELNSLFLYPNPNTGSCNIKGKSLKYVSEVMIRNTLGQLMIAISVENKGNEILSFDVSTLPSGCYWLTVKTVTGEERTLKMIRTGL